MKNITLIASAVLFAALSVTGCDKQGTPVQNAVEGTKDALNIREHEKLQDAGEDAKDAIEGAVEGLKEETGAK